MADAQYNAGICLSVHADRYKNADQDGKCWWLWWWDTWLG